eukprot:gene10090-22794_t
MGSRAYWYQFAHQPGAPDGRSPPDVLVADPRWPALQRRLSEEGRRWNASFGSVADMASWTSRDPRAQVWDRVTVDLM